MGQGRMRRRFSVMLQPNSLSKWRTTGSTVSEATMQLPVPMAITAPSLEILRCFATLDG